MPRISYLGLTYPIGITLIVKNVKNLSFENYLVLDIPVLFWTNCMQKRVSAKKVTTAGVIKRRTSLPQINSHCLQHNIDIFILTFLLSKSVIRAMEHGLTDNVRSAHVTHSFCCIYFCTRYAYFFISFTNSGVFALCGTGTSVVRCAQNLLTTCRRDKNRPICSKFIIEVCWFTCTERATKSWNDRKICVRELEGYFSLVARECTQRKELCIRFVYTIHRTNCNANTNDSIPRWLREICIPWIKKKMHDGHKYLSENFNI